MSEDLRDIFFAECEDLLEALTGGLERLRSAPGDNDTINAIFRAVHSIKGAAGAFALDDLVKFAHRFETVLDHIRSGKTEADEEVLRISTRAADILADLVEAARDETGSIPDTYDSVLETLTELAANVADPDGDDGVEAVFAPLAFNPIDLAPLEAQASYVLQFTPGEGFYDKGHDPISYFTALAELGEIEVICNLDSLPELDSLAPEASCLSWEVRLKGDVTEGEIGRIFAFAEGLCSLSITEVTEPGFPALNLDLGGGEADPASADAATELEPETEPQAGSAPVPAHAGRMAPTAPAADKVEAPQRDAGAASPAQAPRATLRVDPEKVDRLINTVGELIINQAVITQKLLANGVPKNSDILDDLDIYRHLARDIQEAVMSIRAQPVKPLFQRMSRIARESAEAIGKDVELVTLGENTEVDKSVVERLADPLTHIIRNAIDHGIEPPEKRLEAGKPQRGRVVLSAAHRSGHVLIEINDDGGGINRQKVFETAVRKELISADAKLSDAEIDALLFIPGFSTATTVTNLSGRGVGMDVVKTTISSLGGRVAIASTPGKGSTLSISLPLTLAVLDGMVVSVAGQTMVLPLSSIVETTRLRPADVIAVGPGSNVMAVRGDYVPIVDLAETLGLRANDEDPDDRTVVLVQAYDGAVFALAVSSISDQRQVVIKSIEGNYAKVPGVSAATILGDGKIALIVDIDAIIGLVADKSNRHPKSNGGIDHGLNVALG